MYHDIITDYIESNYPGNKEMVMKTMAGINLQELCLLYTSRQAIQWAENHGSCQKREKRCSWTSLLRNQGTWMPWSLSPSRPCLLYTSKRERAMRAK